MDLTILNWLNELLEDGKTRGEYLAYLFFCNGANMNVTSWGILSYRNGHQLGLEQHEALQLIYMSGMLAGMQIAGVDTDTYLTPILDKYYTKNFELAKEFGGAGDAQ